MKWDRERQISYDITFMWNLKKGTDELICKIEIENIDKTNLWLLEGKGEGINWETGIDM